MSRVLSQEEIDALIGSAAVLDGGRKAAGPVETAHRYDFRLPDRVSKEQLQSLHFLHDRFARNVSTSLSAYLRTITEVAMVSVEQFTYAECLMSLPDPTAFYAVSLEPVEALGVLEMNPSVAFTMVDRMLGGRGEHVTLTRALTEIEQHVVDAVVKLILKNLTETWEPIAGIRFEISGRETRPQMLQVAAPNEAMIQLVFDVRVGEARGMLNLCLPTGALDAFDVSLSHGHQRPRREPSALERRAFHENLGRVSFPVSAVIDTSLSARELLQLEPGDVLSLGVPTSRPLTVRIAGVDKHAGIPVLVGSQAGVRLTAPQQEGDPS